MQTRTAAVVFGVITLLAGCSTSTEALPPTATTPASTPSPTAAPDGPIRGPEPSVATPLVASVLYPHQCRCPRPTAEFIWPMRSN